MFDVIDVSKCRAAVLSKLAHLSAAIGEGAVSDASGARMSSLTIDEAYTVARRVVEETVYFVSTNASRYIVQFPEILGMELVGSSVSDSVASGLRSAVFGRVEDDVREFVASQFSDYGIDDLDRTVSAGLAMFERYLVNDPYAPLRIRPAKVTSYLSDISETSSEGELKLLVGQMNSLSSELRNRSLDARQAARALREASQFCLLAASGEVALAQSDGTSPAMAVACRA